MNKKSILVFGVGELQKSIIKRAQNKGLYVVGIDPCETAFCKDDVDAFEVVGGQDFERTLEVAKKYSISAVVTAATDKPLVMMARVAKELNLPFYTEDTAKWSTDKFLMKQKFIEGGVPCAKGKVVKNIEDVSDFVYPVIVKPRDNSGSRGVKLCRNVNELKSCMDEALEYSHFDSVLVEEFIEGQEYSIESLHYNGKTEVLQFTEKKTTEFPYNVELGHKQPALLTEKQQNDIRVIIQKIADSLEFENCPSHTELKINNRGIFVIETSPRLGGDYITSTLVPLSTGINMEDQLLNIALGEPVDTVNGRVNKASGVCFFSLPEGKVLKVGEEITSGAINNEFIDFLFKLKEGDFVNPITSSLNRYGHLIVTSDTRSELDDYIKNKENEIYKRIEIGK